MSEQKSLSQPLTSMNVTSIKHLWPMFVQFMSITLSYGWIFINVVFISFLIWPNEPFHAAHLGLLYGSGMIVKAFGGLLFGYLADRFSRIKIMTMICFCFGIGYVANAFVPAGQALFSFYLFIGLNSFRQIFDGGLMPVSASYVDDMVGENQKSQVFGLGGIIFQLFQFIGFLISAFVFQRFWKEFFVVLGVIMIIASIVISMKGKEPKRGAKKDELKVILQQGNVQYNYQLDKQTIRETILSPTNILAFAEGLFTNILYSVPNFILYAYFQSSPRNLSPTVMSIFFAIFAIPGLVMGPILFAKLSDRLATKNIKNRLYLIVIGMVIIFSGWIIAFQVDVPPLTVEEGNNLAKVMSLGPYWALAFITFIFWLTNSLYGINQAPILQKINLPEAQGTIVSTNQFLEAIGFGLGPIISGYLLEYYGGNYPLTVLILMCAGIIGCLFWLLATKTVMKDIDRISSILSKRAIELGKNPNPIAK